MTIFSKILLLKHKKKISSHLKKKGGIIIIKKITWLPFKKKYVSMEMRLHKNNE
jgi:hypothetical protein